MVAEEHDEVTYAKIVAAAEEIRAMARHKPAQSAAMFAQARHLFELAEQIRNDLLSRRGARPPGEPLNPGSDGAAKPASDDRVWATHSVE